MGNDFSKCPTLQLGKWASLDDADTVTNLTLVGLVVDVIFLGTFDDFVEFRMGNTCDVLNHEGLVHLVGNDHADAGFTEVDLRVR